MYSLILATSARKSLKRLSRSGRFDKKEFDSVVHSLRVGKKLHAKYQDHQLKGELSDFRECHLAFNLLVQYRRFEQFRVLSIEKIGTHDELFG